jgi:hypothetical protein
MTHCQAATLQLTNMTPMTTATLQPAGQRQKDTVIHRNVHHMYVSNAYTPVMYIVMNSVQRLAVVPQPQWEHDSRAATAGRGAPPRRAMGAWHVEHIVHINNGSPRLQEGP